MVGKLLPRSPPLNALTLLLDAITSSRWRCRYINFHQLCDTTHRLTYHRPHQHHIHVRGYKEQGNINTPLELAIRNQTDRFSLAIDAIDRIPRFQVTGSHAREALLNQQIACKAHAYESGIDSPDIVNWQWPFLKGG